MKIIAIYPGRFQPMGLHHYETYRWIAGKFGRQNTYIASSDKTESGRSPLTFAQKQKIATELGVPKDKFVKVKNPYVAVEVLDKYNPDQDRVVFVYGKKDTGRVKFTKKDGSPGYFQPMPKRRSDMEPFGKHGYIIEAPDYKAKLPNGKPMSGTEIRNYIKTATEKQFEDFFGFFDKDIYDTLNQTQELKEATTAGGLVGSEVDDGPRYFYGNYNSYKSFSDKMAEKLGKYIANYLVGKEDFEKHDTQYPKGPPQSVSYFPVGDVDAVNAGTNYHHSTSTANSYRQYAKWIQELAKKMQYSVVGLKDLDQKQLTKESKIDWSWDNIIKQFGPLSEQITRSQLKSIERYADKLFKACNIDVNLSKKHFFDRLNDRRNKKPITGNELRRLFKSTFNKHVGKIDKMNADAQAVIKSMRSDINVPFILKRDKANREFDLVAKTIMRKKNFRTRDPVLKVENIISEGGAAGHMSHVIEDTELTFADLKEIIKRALQGTLDVEQNVTEKTDGFNFLVTYKNGQVGAARNKSTIKDPMTIQQISAKFDGRGAIKDAFIFALQDLQAAILNIPEKKLNQFFGNEITRSQLKSIERYAGKLFKAYDIDVDLSKKHFFDRLRRNKKPITGNELRRLFKSTFNEHVGKIDKMNADAQAVIKSMRSDISVPFVIVWDEANREFDLVAKTHKFINLEIIYPETENTVYYGNTAYLQFHGVLEFNQDAKKVGYEPEKGQEFQKMISDVNASIQQHFRIIPPVVLDLKQTDDSQQKIQKNFKLLDLIQKNNGLDNNNTIADYYVSWWKRYIDKHFDLSDEDVIEGIARRWSGLSKSFRLNSKNIPNKQLLKQLKAFEKNKAPDLQDKLVDSIELIISRVGIEVVRNASNLLAASPDESKKQIAKKLKSAVERVKGSNDSQKLKKLQKLLNKLVNLGGEDAIIPSEGIVFKYKGKLYKLTGSFTAVHRIISLLPFKESLNTNNKLRIHEGGNVGGVNSLVGKHNLLPTVQYGLRLSGLQDLDYSLVGNVNKEYLGDVDLAVSAEQVQDIIGSGSLESFWQDLEQFLSNKKIQNYKLVKGLSQFHIVVPVVDSKGVQQTNIIDRQGSEGSEPAYCQIDIMLGDLRWMKKALSGSENSKFKAVYRNMLLVDILSQIIFETKNPEIKRKFQINWKKGVQLVQFKMTPKGKKKKLKVFKIFGDMDQLAKVLFGRQKSFSDIDSFEKLWKELNSQSFRFKKFLPDIKQAYIKTLNRMNLVIPDQIN